MTLLPMTYYLYLMAHDLFMEVLIEIRMAPWSLEVSEAQRQTG